jgi:two-component system sensor histidine kinase/response regulator
MPNALVVDDCRLPADTLCQMLRLLDVDAHVAYGSTPAILYLSQVTPDVVFLDINMPGVGGFEVLSFLKREPRMAHVPVVFVTADDSPETAAQARKEGAIALIIKPATIESIENVLQSARII